MSLFAQGTIHRASEAFLNGDLFHSSRQGNSHDLAERNRVYWIALMSAEDWCCDDSSGGCHGWYSEDADGHLWRYMNAFARKIQRCWFNRQEQPMACPCPEDPF